ncbi:U2 snRNP-associated SURP motif-containing protein-like [Ostrinia furnacalis]|uniref:U2 snRNP-associated SURP motif-containing protein-like n=1 Tax=Ostrinia furnacalis TaxID=93504 RepID=UPI00103A0A1B|nr:U2 snRNP-associated SURP motif-containing protein-like [Ostrinia furnacalis]
MRACHAAWQALGSRLQREGFRARVTRVLQAWADWAVYPTDFLLHINDVFLGQEKEIAASAGAAGEAAASPARSSSSEEWEGGGGAGPLDGAALRRLAAGRRLPATPAPRPADPDIDGVPGQSHRCRPGVRRPVVVLGPDVHSTDDTLWCRAALAVLLLCQPYVNSRSRAKFASEETRSEYQADPGLSGTIP